MAEGTADDGGGPVTGRRGPAEVLTGWVLAGLAVLGAVSGWLPWLSGPGRSRTVTLTVTTADVYGKGARQTLAPLVVGAVIAVVAAGVATVTGRERRTALLVVGGLAFLAELALLASVVSSGQRFAGRPDTSLEVGWYLQLLVLVAGAAAIAAAGLLVVRVVRTGDAAVPSGRTGALVGATLLGLAVAWLLGQDFAFLGSWIRDEPLGVPLSTVTRAAAWIAALVTALGPALAVASARHRLAATGLVLGWWAFLVVLGTTVVLVGIDLASLGRVSRAFWFGAVLAVIGGLALLRWLGSPARPRTGAEVPIRTGPPPSLESFRRADEDPLRP